MHTLPQMLEDIREMILSWHIGYKEFHEIIQECYLVQEITQ